MIKVGLTGNMGSGKSTVAHIFEVLGAPVFHADAEAGKMLARPDVIDEVVSHFGKEILKDGAIDRKALAAIVFQDREALSHLNGIIHPRVRQKLLDWTGKQKDRPYVIQESAILFESGFHTFFDVNILVSCPEDIAVLRVIKRDGIGEEQVRERLKNQWPEERKKELADHIILNDGSTLIIPQVMALHRQFTDQ